MPGDMPDAGSDSGDLAVMAHGEMVVLQGPRDIIDRFVASDPTLSSATPRKPKGPGTTGALSLLTTVLSASRGAGVSGGDAPMLFQLDAAGMEMFTRGGLAEAASGDGWLRLFGHGAEGIAGHGALKPAALPQPQQLMGAQLALVTLALTSAIQDVQAAVERVEDKVDVIRTLLESEREGDIIGAHRSLSRRAEQLDFTGTLTDADWHAIDDMGVMIEQQIERLRSFVRTRLTAAEEARRRIDGRVEAVDLVKQLTDTLALLVVAQDSLFLFQQLRLTRIRDTQPDQLRAAQTEALSLLDQHRADDQDLLRRAREVVAERASVDPLEIHRFRSVRSLVDTVAEVDGQLAWFAGERTLDHSEIGPVAEPGLGDAVAAAKERGGALVDGTRDLAGRALARRKASANALEAGDQPTALTAGETTGDDAEPAKGSAGDEDPPGRTSRLRRGAGQMLSKARRAETSDE